MNPEIKMPLEKERPSAKETQEIQQIIETTKKRRKKPRSFRLN